ncbi:MAG: T9SS type A sorting domain-containing protein [Bacteroidetes bacterium]|nr:MAG: T9SS type A sorting domain-containing protein [Bacteroidota bacterium]
MKKLLLISTALLIGTFVVNAQSQRLLKPSMANKGFPILKNLPTDFQFPSTTTQEPAVIPAKSSNVLAGTLLGYTCYELQSNNAAGRQIQHHSDGTLSFIWTIDSVCLSGNAGRGSGYNYWNGTSLLKPTGTVGRIETIRTGFSQIALLGTPQKEVVFAHKGPPSYDFYMSTNASKGSNIWTGINAGATALLPFPGTAPAQALWGRIATGGSDGNSIHLIANYFTGAGKDKGITEPTVYSRSLDAGQSWNDQSVMLPGYDSTHTLNGSGETYAIDADITTVAIVYGGLDADVVLWKSTDNGTTFTRTSVDGYAFEPTFDSTSVANDSTQTNDGAVTVVLAPNGTAHVAYSLTYLYRNATDDTTSFDPTYAGLIYWNDVAKNKVYIPVTLNDVDCPRNGGNGTNAWEVAKYTSNINANAAPTPPSARYGNRCFLTIPSIAVDGNNVFILFSLVSDGDSTNDGQSYRDIWIIASQDGGVTFGDMQNVTCSLGEEEFFSSLAKRVDANLHYMYDLDTEPGTNIQNGDPIAASEMRYGTIDKAKVLAGTASCNPSAPVCTSGIEDYETAVFSITGTYPNPANGLTFIDVSMKQNASVSLEIYNSIGGQVYVSSRKLSTGKHTISFDASAYASGLYFYTIKSGDAVVSGKITVVTK